MKKIFVFLLCLLYEFLSTPLSFSNMDNQETYPIKIEEQNQLMEEIFRNVTYEISILDFNQTLSKNITLEATVEKYTKQLLQLNKLLNSIFLINVKNYVRNYTNQIQEIITNALCETNLVSFSLSKLLTIEDMKRMNERLYRFVFQAKGANMLNKSNSDFNETEEYIVGNEIMKGIIRYFLGKNKKNAEFSNKLVNSFDFSLAITCKWPKIKKETQNHLTHLKIHSFIRNSSIPHEVLEDEVLFNSTWLEIETGIRDGKILIDIGEYTRNRTEISKGAEFERVRQPITVIYISILLIFVLVACFLLAYKIIINRREEKNYQKF